MIHRACPCDVGDLLLVRVSPSERDRCSLLDFKYIMNYSNRVFGSLGSFETRNALSFRLFRRAASSRLTPPP